MKWGRAIRLVHLVHGLLVAGLAQIPYDHAINVLFYLVFFLIRIHTCLKHSMEVAIEALVRQLDVELLNNVLHNEELAILNRLLKRLLYVPEHQIL